MQYPSKQMRIKGKKAVDGIWLVIEILLGILLIGAAFYAYIQFKDSGVEILLFNWW